jgi:hypothetical protein
MDRRTFLGILASLWLVLQAVSAGAAETAVAYLRIDGMT